MSQGPRSLVLHMGEALICTGDLAGARHYLGIACENGQNHTLHGVACGWLALALNFDGRHEEAEPHARSAVANPHTQFWANVALIIALSGQDKVAEAEEARMVLQAFRPGVTCSLILRLSPMTRPEQVEMILLALRRAGLPE